MVASKVFVSEVAVCKILAKYTGKQICRSPFKVRLCENSKSSYFPKRTLLVSLPFGQSVSFVFVQGYQKV